MVKIEYHIEKRYFGDAGGLEQHLVSGGKCHSLSDNENICCMANSSDPNAFWAEDSVVDRYEREQHGNPAPKKKLIFIRIDKVNE